MSITNNNIDNMLEVSPIKQLVKLGVPAVIIALFNEINGMVDAIFMGQYFGPHAVASMAVILPFFIFVSALAFLFSEGAGIAIGRYLGAKDIDSANKCFGNTLFVTFIAGTVIGLVAYFLVPLLLPLFNLTPDAYYYADIYIKIFCLGLPLIMIPIVLSKMVYTEGHSKFLLKVTVVQIVINIGINYLFIAGLGFGVVMIAVATVFSLLVQSLVLIKFIQSKRMVLKISKQYLLPNKAYFKEVIPLGLSTFVTMILLSFTLGVESKIISDFGGEALGVQTITGYIFSATSSIAYGIMGAALVLMSYSVGAKNKTRYYEVVKISLVAVFVSSLVLNLPLALKSDIVVRLFTDSSKLVNIIKIPALVYGLTAPFIFTTNVILYAMQPVGMEKTSTVIFALQQVIFFIPLLFILKPFGFVYAISAQPSAEVVGGILTLALIPMLLSKTKTLFRKEVVYEN